MIPSDDYRHYAIEVKPVGAACNLRCAYCYYLGTGSGQSATPALMADNVLDSYIRQVVAIHGRWAEIEFAWHGGEPTLAGLPFFERVVRLQEQYATGRRILNTLQTNGTRLTDDWCRFFHDHHFRIGISIDGPEYLHDIYRKDANGQGTFARTMRGLEMLLKHNVELNILTTVNAANADHPDEVYNFLRQYTDFMQFLPVVECLPQTVTKNVAIPPGLYTADATNPRRLAPYSVTASAYGRFLCIITDLWLQKDFGHKFVQAIEAAIGNLTCRPAGLCVHEAVCGHCAVVEKNGDLFRCDRYVFPEYRIGNILASPLHDMMQTNRRFGEHKLDSLPHECLHCDVADLCFGGCPKDRLLERLSLSGIERRNYLCDGYRQFFRHIREVYPTIMNKLKLSS